jgi:hypothetical protein
MVLREKTDVKATCDIYDYGIGLHLTHEMLKRCKLTPLYGGLPAHYYIWGNLEICSWTRVIKYIVTERSDIAVGNLWYTCHIINKVECLFPHFTNSSRWFVP